MQHKLLHLTILTLLLLTLAGCRFGQKPLPTPAPLAMTNGDVYTVQRGDIITELTFPGRINLKKQQELFFTREGRINNILVQNGDLVAAGAVIAELDNEQLSVDLATAELDVEIAQNKQEKAKAEQAFSLQIAQQKQHVAEVTLAALLSKDLAKPGSVEAKDIATAQEELIVAKIELERLGNTDIDDLTLRKDLLTAEVHVRQLQDDIQRSQLVAPFAGKIRFLTGGTELTRYQQVKAYDPIMAIIDPSSLQIEANPTQQQVGLLAEGLPVQIALAYRPGVSLTGTIQALPYPQGTGIDPFPQISISEKVRNKLQAGGSVEIKVAAQQRVNVLWLPPAAIRITGQAAYVTVQEGDTEREVKVTLGVRTEDKIEIVAGLSENQVVLGQ